MSKKKSNADKICSLMRKIEALGGVAIVWTVDDMPGSSDDERAEQLDQIAQDLESRSIEAGSDLIDDAFDDDDN